MAPETSFTDNYLLATLPKRALVRLEPHWQTVGLHRPQILYDAGDLIEYAYFPHRSMVSLVATMVDGETVEVGLIGNEGMVGLAGLLGDGIAFCQHMVQVSGSGTKIPLSALRQEFNRTEELHDLILLYTQAQLLQLSQWAACNQLHTLEERLARWLLSVADHLGDDELPLTQEFIAEMLGTRRQSVTITLGLLKQAGMIHYERGLIKIINRTSLETLTCECYQAIRSHFQRLLGIRPGSNARDR